MDFKRYLYPQINWDARVISIKDERGIGKTTTAEQQAKSVIYMDDPKKVKENLLKSYWKESIRVCLTSGR